MPEQLIGEIVHYFDKLGVAVIKIKAGDLAVGDTVKFKRGKKEFQQLIGSLEIDRQPVGKIKTGEEAGLKTNEPVKEGWQVYKVMD